MGHLVARLPEERCEFVKAPSQVGNFATFPHTDGQIFACLVQTRRFFDLQKLNLADEVACLDVIRYVPFYIDFKLAAARIQ